MAELQRSAMSFRRQGSSGQVFDDKFLKELDKITKQQQNNNNQQDNNNNDNHIQQQGQGQDEVVKPTVSVGSIDRSRSNGGGGRAFRTGKVTPAIEPPSPRLSACGICSSFGKRDKLHRKPKPAAKRRI